MKKVITLKNPVAITAFSCVGGKKEGDGLCLPDLMKFAVTITSE